MIYLLFAGNEYYPSGGAKDFRGTFDTSEAAQIARPNCDWAHVAEFDGKTMRILREWEAPDYGGTGWREPR